MWGCCRRDIATDNYLVRFACGVYNSLVGLFLSVSGSMQEMDSRPPWQES
jgi:hypothetical protein